MDSPRDLTRRAALLRAGAGIAGACIASSGCVQAVEPPLAAGSIRQSVPYWCYRAMPLAAFCDAAKAIGLQSVELLNPDQVLIARQAGLACAVMNCGGVSIKQGLNRPDNHPRILAGLAQAIDVAADLGVANVITFAGNREGMADDEGAAHAIECLKRIAGHAEDKKVTIVLELLNSKIEHADYMGDHMSWGVKVVAGVGSQRVKLLYDIYHMQVMEGDIIATIRAHHGCIGHYHTGGVPGRHEIDASQELCYPAIVQAIAATGYQGYIAHEFIPTRDPLSSLAEAYRLCAAHA